MVVESTVGMVTGSVAYRMRGQGRIISIYGGQQPHLDMVKMYNLTAKDINIIQVDAAMRLFVIAYRSERMCIGNDNVIHLGCSLCGAGTGRQGCVSAGLRGRGRGKGSGRGR